MNSSRIMGRFLVQNKWVKHTFIHWLTGTEKHPSLTFKPTTQSSLLFHATNKFNLVLSWKSNKCQKSAFWCHIHTLIEAIFQNKHKRKKLQLWQLEAEIWNCVSRLPLLQYSRLRWLAGQETVVEDAMYLISLFRFYFVAFLLIFTSLSVYN